VTVGQAGTILLLLTIVGLLEAVGLTLADRYRTASIFFLAIAIIMAAYTGLKPWVPTDSWCAPRRGWHHGKACGLERATPNT
jgi:hypothetical protein